MLGTLVLTHFFLTLALLLNKILVGLTTLGMDHTCISLNKIALERVCQNKCRWYY